ncbi:hypothetical protein K1719_044677 [Acacia pycnantha]|nr:hypothetical protein K1719_045043 [Acacia pycnantha]KAI9073336.1 hypothetical protein K1719_044677 [Acacia pycnantha]
MNPQRSLPGKSQGPIMNIVPRRRCGAGEVAGGTAAECTAIFCCLPCTVMDMVVLVVYKVPAGLCRKAIHTYKGKPQPRTLKKEEDVLLNERSGAKCRPNSFLGTTLEDHLAAEAEKENLKDVSEFGKRDEQNGAPFNVTGFWRSHSQKLQS